MLSNEIHFNKEKDRGLGMEQGGITDQDEGLTREKGTSYRDLPSLNRAIAPLSANSALA